MDKRQIRNIASGDAEVKKGMFKHEGLIAGLVEILGQKGDEHKTVRERLVEILGQKGDEHKMAREHAVWTISNIASGDDEVKKEMFKH